MNYPTRFRLVDDGIEHAIRPTFEQTETRNAFQARIDNHLSHISVVNLRNGKSVCDIPIGSGDLTLDHRGRIILDTRDQIDPFGHRMSYQAPMRYSFGGTAEWELAE